MTDAEKLIQLVRKAQDKKELLIIRDLAIKLQMKQQHVLELACDVNLDVNVAEGNRGGYYSYESIGDYTIEDVDYKPVH